MEEGGGAVVAVGDPRQGQVSGHKGGGPSHGPSGEKEETGVGEEERETGGVGEGEDPHFRAAVEEAGGAGDGAGVGIRM